MEWNEMERNEGGELRDAQKFLDNIILAIVVILSIKCEKLCSKAFKSLYMKGILSLQF